MRIFSLIRISAFRPVYKRQGHFPDNRPSGLDRVRGRDLKTRGVCVCQNRRRFSTSPKTPRPRARPPVFEPNPVGRFGRFAHSVRRSRTVRSHDTARSVRSFAPHTYTRFVDLRDRCQKRFQGRSSLLLDFPVRRGRVCRRPVSSPVVRTRCRFVVVVSVRHVVLLLGGCCFLVVAGFAQFPERFLSVGTEICFDLWCAKWCDGFLDHGRVFVLFRSRSECAICSNFYDKGCSLVFLFIVTVVTP